MDLALRAGILLFNLESEAELHVLAERARENSKARSHCLPCESSRSRQNAPLHHHWSSRAQVWRQYRQAPGLYADASEQDWLEPVGISVHIGSQITDVEPFRETMERVVGLAEQLMRDGLNIGLIDAGGGLGISTMETSLLTSHPLSADTPRRCCPR